MLQNDRIEIASPQPREDTALVGSNACRVGIVNNKGMDARLVEMIQGVPQPGHIYHSCRATKGRELLQIRTLQASGVELESARGRQLHTTASTAPRACNH